MELGSVSKYLDVFDSPDQLDISAMTNRFSS